MYFLRVPPICSVLSIRTFVFLCLALLPLKQYLTRYWRSANYLIACSILRVAKQEKRKKMQRKYMIFPLFLQYFLVVQGIDGLLQSMLQSDPVLREGRISVQKGLGCHFYWRSLWNLWCWAFVSLVWYLIFRQWVMHSQTALFVLFVKHHWLGIDYNLFRSEFFLFVCPFLLILYQWLLDSSKPIRSTFWPLQIMLKRMLP